QGGRSHRLADRSPRPQGFQWDTSCLQWVGRRSAGLHRVADSFGRFSTSPASGSHRHSERAGYGSGRASWVTSTGQRDVARTAWVVDVHWRGGPITSRSTSVFSAILTISAAATPALTTT